MMYFLFLLFRKQSLPILQILITGDQSDQYVAISAIRHKCSKHVCCYSFFPHLNIKILSFFHYFNLIDENSDNSSTTAVNINNK